MKVSLHKPGKPFRTWEAWLVGNELHTLEITFARPRVPAKQETKPFPSAAAAQAALDEMAARLRAEGFAAPAPLPDDETAATADEKPSKAWPKADRPAWLARLSDPLAKQHVKITKLLKSARLDHRTKDVESLMRVGIGFKLKTTKASAIPAEAVTRFGGDPDVPAEFAWPKQGRAPLAFLAQLRLDELKDLDLEKKLPAKGLLSVFGLMNPDHDGYAEVVRVFFFDEPKKLARRKPDHDAETDGRPTKVCLAVPSVLLTLPGPRRTGDEDPQAHERRTRALPRRRVEQRPLRGDCPSAARLGQRHEPQRLQERL